MITLEVRVNGNIIATASVINTGTVLEDGRTVYDARTMQFPINHEEDAVVGRLQILHKRADGAMSLIQKVAKEMTK